MVLAEGEISVVDTPTELRQKFKCGYLIETGEEHADELEGIVRAKGITVELERTEQGVKMVIPAEDHHSLSTILAEMHFNYLMSIQSLEEKIFSHIQDTEMAVIHKRDNEINSTDDDVHPRV
jgi:hypothetical protein